MVEEKNNKNQILVIIGLVALVLVLFMGIKFVFAALDTAVPDLKHMATEYEESHSETSGGADQTGDMSVIPAGEEGDGPNFCPHCGEALFEGFRWEQYCPDCGEQVTNGGV